MKWAGSIGGVCKIKISAVTITPRTKNTTEIAMCKHIIFFPFLIILLHSCNEPSSNNEVINTNIQNLSVDTNAKHYPNEIIKYDSVFEKLNRIIEDTVSIKQGDGSTAIVTAYLISDTNEDKSALYKMLDIVILKTLAANKNNTSFEIHEKSLLVIGRPSRYSENFFGSFNYKTKTKDSIIVETHTYCEFDANGNFIESKKMQEKNKY